MRVTINPGTGQTTIVLEPEEGVQLSTMLEDVDEDFAPEILITLARELNTAEEAIG